MVILLQKFILILVRITAFIVLCPAFSFKGLSNIFKVAFSICVTFVVYMYTPDMEIIGESLVFTLLVIKETLLGLTLGYVTKLLFSIMEIAGQLIDFQIGYSMASVYDPSIGNTASNYGKLYYWMSICIFFILDLHHQVILTIIESFDFIPLTLGTLSGINIESIVYIFGITFSTAFNIAAPMIIVILITDIVMGIIARTVPQINVLMLGMPMKSIVGFFVMMIMLSSLVQTTGNTLLLIPEYLEKILTFFK
ncbi:MAG: flagellar biosynthetic protein FliR [Eubacteriaceae bacterium]